MPQDTSGPTHSIPPSEALTLPPATVPKGAKPTPAPHPGEAITLCPEEQTPFRVTASGPSVPGYEILCEVGRGGMGVVYKARHIALQRLVALKVNLLGGHAGSQELQRFRTEAETLARLRHPHIVQIYEVGESQGYPFLGLEFVDGGSLADKIDGTPFPARQAAELVEIVARAMHVAHQQGVLHRDLKPGNVMLTADGQPKITDFGLAKKLDDTSGQTATGTILGTPSYMAPEQTQSKVAPIGPTADVYALGAILYELLTGRPPFRASTPMDTVLQVISEEPVAPSRLQPKVPRDLNTICLKCLEKPPGKRYASAQDLAEDLRRFLEGRPIAARPVGPLQRSWRWCRRNPVVASLLAAVAASLLAGTGIASHFAVQAAAHAQEAEASALEVQRRLYIADMRLAQGAWDNARLAQLKALLEEHRPERTGGTDLRDFEWYYWERLTHNTSLYTLTAPSGPATSVAFSPDGRLLAGGWGHQGIVKVWGAEIGQERLSLQGPACVRPEPTEQQPSGVLSVAFRPDSQRLAACGEDGMVKVWDLRTGKDVLTFKGADRFATCVAFSPNGQWLAVGSLDRSIEVWDAATGAKEKELTGHTDAVYGVAFSPDGKHLATAARDKKVIVWDLMNGQGQSLPLPEQTSNKWAVAYNGDGKLLAYGGTNGEVGIWDLERQQLRLMPVEHKGAVWSVAFSPDGKQLATGSLDQTIRLWDVATREEITCFKGHESWVKSVAFSADGKRLASAGGDFFSFEPGKVRVWNLVTRQGPVSLSVGNSPVDSVVFGSAGNLLASASRDGLVHLWDADGGKELRPPLRLATPPTNNTTWSVCLAISADGRHLAAASGEGIVKIWDLETREEIVVAKERRLVTSLAFSPNHLYLAWTAETDKIAEKVSLWDLTRQELHVLDFSASRVAFSPDSRHLAAALKNDIWVRDLATGQQVLPSLAHEWTVNAVHYSPDGKWLASASKDKTVKVWNAASGEEIHCLRGHGQYVYGVAFSPNGKRLASASVDRSVKVWDLESGQEVLSLPVDGAARSVTFNAAGDCLACASNTGKVWLWYAARRSRP